ncbi:MAG: CRISPR-associated ring nuclease Csm6 [Desulfocapsaceae bacterium]|nr:CRISPR-associated ring nuclease Csm6 [Desulfocapsaceae bacterium]
MKNILLAVCGLSPQVITEALYALMHEGRKIHAIHLITTRRGRDCVLTDLLAPTTGKYYSLLADYEIDHATINFHGGNLHVLHDSSGRELDDIISPEDNEILMQACLDHTFHFTSRPDNAVFFLVAGGRKTMTSCLTLAAQLYGRQQDRIFHVLVSPEFENSREFFYPPRQSIALELRDNQGQPFWKESRFARIHLISIPFVSVREQLCQDLLDRPLPPADLMQSLVRETPQILTVSLAEGKLVYGLRELDLDPTRLALYAFFAERKQNCRLSAPCTNCSACFLEAATVIDDKGIARFYERIPGSRLLGEMSDSGIGNLNKENFQSYKSKIKRDILTAFGQSAVFELEIASIGTRPDTTYGIRLDRNRIRIKE